MNNRHPYYYHRSWKRRRGQYPQYYMRYKAISFRELVILILILLQFGAAGPVVQQKLQIVDNSILFIIALYFLTCCRSFD